MTHHRHRRVLQPQANQTRGLASAGGPGGRPTCHRHRLQICSLHRGSAPLRSPSSELQRGSPPPARSFAYLHWALQLNHLVEYGHDDILSFDIILSLLSSYGVINYDWFPPCSHRKFWGERKMKETHLYVLLFNWILFTVVLQIPLWNLAKAVMHVGAFQSEKDVSSILEDNAIWHILLGIGNCVCRF